MDGKKPSLIVSLLGKKGSPPGGGLDEPKGPMDDDMPDEGDGGDEGTQLAGKLLDAQKMDDPSSFYDAFCALMDHHLAKDEDDGEAPKSDRLLPVPGADEE